MGNALKPRSENVSKETNEKSGQIFRMPLFVASSASLAKAQEFTWIRDNGIACPILEFIVEKGRQCDSVARIENLSHFPDEKEWLMCPYTPFEYRSQRLEYLEIGSHRVIKLVMIVRYIVLPHHQTFEIFEAKGQDVKTAVILCKPPALAFSRMELEDEEAMMYADEPETYYASAFSELAHTRQDRQRDVSVSMGQELERELERELLRLTEKDARKTLASLEANLKKYNEGKELLNCIEAEVQVLRAEQQSLLDNCAGLETDMKNYEVQKAAVEEAIRILEKKIVLITEKIDNKNDELDSLIVTRNRIESEKCETESEIQEQEEEQAAVRQKIERCEADVGAYKLSMQPLLDEERAAYGRWEARQKAIVDGCASPEAKKDAQNEWRSKIPQVEQAGKEFIDYVFPPSELRKLEDVLNVEENKLNAIILMLKELREKVTALEQSINDANAAIKKCEAEKEQLALDQNALESEKTDKEDALFNLEQRISTLRTDVESKERRIYSIDSEIASKWHNVTLKLQQLVE